MWSARGGGKFKAHVWKGFNRRQDLHLLAGTVDRGMRGVVGKWQTRQWWMWGDGNCSSSQEVFNCHQGRQSERDTSNKCNSVGRRENTRMLLTGRNGSEPLFRGRKGSHRSHRKTLDVTGIGASLRASSWMIPSFSQHRILHKNRTKPSRRTKSLVCCLRYTVQFFQCSF